MRDKTVLILSLIFFLEWGGAVGARACGYHDPTMLAVGALNWRYPESLHVTGAIWEAQKAGALPMPDKERIVARGKTRELLETVAYQKTRRAIRALDAAVQKLNADQKLTPFSLVLVETALWSNFRNGSAYQPVAVDVVGPGEGDLVVVSGEVAILAIQSGNLSLSTAVETGLVKLYGEPEQIREFQKLYGVIGEEPLPPVSPVQIRPKGRTVATGAAN